MRMRRVICVVMGTALVAAIPALADSITYTATGFQSGTIGTKSFNLAAVTVTLTGLTTGIAPSSIDPAFLANPGTATITIAGIGTATLKDSMYAVSTDNSSFGGGNTAFIYDATDGRVLLGAFNGGFLGYGLATSIGPLSGPTFASGCNVNPCNFSTTLGVLNWGGTAGQGPTATFGAEVAPVPEPGSIMLLGTALAAVIGIRKRR